MDFDEYSTVSIRMFKTRWDQTYNQYAVEILCVSHLFALKLKERDKGATNSSHKANELPMGLSLKDAAKAAKDAMKDLKGTPSSGINCASDESEQGNVGEDEHLDEPSSEDIEAARSSSRRSGSRC